MQEAALAHWRNLEALQKHYTSVTVLLEEVMTEMLGFKCSDIQHDIAKYLESGPDYCMIQAQRSQAKTTITAVYAVYSLIHDPMCRILILSAGETQAKEIAGWIIQIIMNMDELECLRPRDTDRRSIEAFDVNFALKGPEKSPSVACVSITGNLQGKRADVLIADDIESSKNSRTAHGRELLKHLIKDFPSICTKGRIIFLGTPQGVDSIYNDLPSIGYDLRVWPGRYPTPTEIDDYGQHLAPLIRRRVQKDPSLQYGGGMTGERGKAVDPVILPEDALERKEHAQGPAYFNLQHMLSTAMTDAERFPLKIGKIGFMSLNTEDTPVILRVTGTAEHQIKPPPGFPVADAIYKIAYASPERVKYTSAHMFIDPAGGGMNGDETSYAVSRYASGYVHIFAVGGVKGGYELEQLEELVSLAKLHKVTRVTIEENYGKGALRKILTPYLLRDHRCGIDHVWNTTQKELRIANIIEPILSSGKLIMDTRIVEDDIRSISRYPAAQRSMYSLFHQMARMTIERGCLAHDDRVEAVAGTVSHWLDMMDVDEQKVQAQAQRDSYNKLMDTDMGGRTLRDATFNGRFQKKTYNSMDRFTRR